MISTLNIALCCPLLCSPRSLLPYAVHAQYCLVLSTLNIALQTRCPHWILPYAVNAQYCLMLTMLNAIHAQYCLVQSTLNIALSCPCLILPCSRPRLILPYSHAACPHSILPYAVHDQYCLMLSTNNIALCCPCSKLPYVFTLNIALTPYAGHAQYCLMLTMFNAVCLHAQYCLCSLNIALSCPCLILPYSRPRLILPTLQSTLYIAYIAYAVHDQYWLSCPCSKLPYAFTLNIALSVKQSQQHEQ